LDASQTASNRAIRSVQKCHTKEVVKTENRPVPARFEPARTALFFQAWQCRPAPIRRTSLLLQADLTEESCDPIKWTEPRGCTCNLGPLG